MDDIGKGKSPKWNCDKYACEDSRSTYCKQVRSPSKLHEGPRGGVYFELGGKKYYVSSRNRAAMIKKYGIEKKAVRLSPRRSSQKGKASPKKRKASPKKRRS